MDDPDYPPEAVNSNIIVEEIEMNGRIQKIFKKTYYLIDGKTINITRMEQAWLEGGGADSRERVYKTKAIA